MTDDSQINSEALGGGNLSAEGDETVDPGIQQSVDSNARCVVPQKVHTAAHNADTNGSGVREAVEECFQQS